MNTIEKLDRLAHLNGIVDEAREKLEQAKAFYLAPVQDDINRATRIYEGVLDAVQDEAASLKREIDAEVLDVSATIKGERLMAVYTKGRETWDGKKLAGYAIAHPEILEARKVGKPSVSLRAVKAQ